MKEKDLEKCLDNLIIKGLIQEAEQDNAEFEAALKKMSDEDFLALIYDTADEPIAASMSMDRDIFLKETVTMANAPSRISLRKAQRVSDEWDAPASLSKPKAAREYKGWKIWAAAIASVAAILLIVFVPAHMDMNSRLCESALLVSETYMNPSKGIDIPSMVKEEVKAMLPELEKQYSISVRQYRDQSMGISGEQIGDIDDTEYYTIHLSPQESGLDLVQAYLKLGIKDKAVKMIHELEATDADPEFREYCRKMLEILE